MLTKNKIELLLVGYNQLCFSFKNMLVEHASRSAQNGEMPTISVAKMTESYSKFFEENSLLPIKLCTITL